MKKIVKIFSLAAVTLILSTATTVIDGSEIEELAINATIPLADLKMSDINGEEISLGELKGEKGLLVMFSCNTCPFVIKSEERISEITKYAKEQGFGVVILNSNEAKRDAEDSPEAMKEYAQKQGFEISYAIDKDSKLADAFGATRTPQSFLFDAKGLVYRGAIDDNVKEPENVKEQYLKAAIDAVVVGEPIAVNSTKSVGCTIKRVKAQ